MLGALAALILGTGSRDLEVARVRRARNALHYLAGMLELTRERSDPRSWPFPLAGPGALPEGMGKASAAPLASIFPEAAFIPRDPWGRAYVVLALQTDAGVVPVVASGGPGGTVEGAAAPGGGLLAVPLPPVP